MNLCPYFPACGGCSSWDQSYAEQRLQKVQKLSELFKSVDLNFHSPIEFASAGEYGLRQRVDFTIAFEEGHFKAGFYDQDKKLISIEKCLQLTPDLQKIYSEFIGFSFKALKKGSVRLRSGPEGLKGAWLDFSNLDIKALLDDQTLLRGLLNAGFIVEMGQKGKRVVSLGEKLKLSDPKPETWFSTQGLTLQCLISDFTQPSALTADILVKQTLDWAKEIPNLQSVIEFGPGIGQFTLGFLQQGLFVDAFEVNASATEQLEKNAERHSLSGKLKIHLGDYQRKAVSSDLKPELAFVNPARSGLKAFTQQILNLQPAYLIYVSCFPETLSEDLKQLSAAYEIKKISIVDQFPQTLHFESAVMLKSKF